MFKKEIWLTEVSISQAYTHKITKFGEGVEKRELLYITWKCKMV